MDSNFVCLGVEMLGNCSYNPADPKSYFTLGHLISVVALILAMTQLSKPIIKFRIKCHKHILKKSKCIAILATLFIFVATILPFIPGEALPLIGYPVFWEFLSALFFVCGGTWLIVKITTTAKFTPENAKQYLEATTSFIAKGDQKELNELAEEISPSILNIINEARKCEGMQKGIKNNEVTETTKNANRILAIWSDKLFCESLICGSPKSAIEIITNLANNPASDVGVYLSNEIINQSFENKNSILYREGAYSSSGLSGDFMRECFGNWEFVIGKYNPLKSWDITVSALTDCKVKKFCECVNIVFKTYIELNDYSKRPSGLNYAIDTMVGIAYYQVNNIDYIPEHELHESRNVKILNVLSNGYENIIKTILAQNSYPNYDFDEKNYIPAKDHSIFGVIANAVYRYLEILSLAKSHENYIKRTALNTWIDVFGDGTSNMSRNQEEIGKRLLFHINNKVSQNLKPDPKRIPIITKLLLSLHGINKSYNNCMVSKFHNELVDNIKEKFHFIYLKEEKFALNMLPQSIKYDPHSNKLIQELSHGQTIELNLDRSPLI